MHGTMNIKKTVHKVVMLFDAIPTVHFQIP